MRQCERDRQLMHQHIKFQEEEIDKMNQHIKFQEDELYRRRHTIGEMQQQLTTYENAFNDNQNIQKDLIKRIEEQRKSIKHLEMVLSRYKKLKKKN
jgi:hypothetical protein